MADTEIPNLTAITAGNLASGDLFVVVDVSDTTQDAQGTAKIVTKGQIDTLYEPAGTVATHEADTTNVHGIADTSVLLTTTAAPELIRDTIGTALVAGSNITITPNDGADADTITIAASAGGSVATDAIFDAKGDLAVGTGADTAVKLTVGSNGKRLVAYSTASQGVAWTGTGHPRFGDSNRGMPTRLSIPNGGVTTQAYLANRAHYFPFQIDAPITISTARAEVTTLGAGAMEMWIYNCTETAGDVYPSTLASDLGNVSVSSTGGKSITSLSVTLPPGLYAVVWVTDVTVTLRVHLNTFMDHADMNVTGPNLFNEIVAAYKSLTYTTTAPANFPTGPPTYSIGATTASRWYCPIWFEWS